MPGHGPVQSIKYVDRQRAVLLAWKGAVADAVAKGWTRDETIARVRFDDAFGPVDVGQGYMMDHIQNGNAGSLWDKFTATGVRQGPLARLVRVSATTRSNRRDAISAASRERDRR